MSTSTMDGLTPGGPSGSVDLGTAVLRKCAVSRMNNNAYLVTCTATGHQLLVDAAADVDRLMALVTEGSGTLDTIVTTHRHWDHVRALPELARRTGAHTAASVADAPALPLAPDILLTGGDVLSVGEVHLDLVVLRGHTPGGLAVVLRTPGNPVHIMTGDSLFPGGVGATEEPDQDFEELLADVTARIFERFDDDTVIHPGHGDGTTLGAERPHLAEWAARGW